MRTVVRIQKADKKGGPIDRAHIHAHEGDVVRTKMRREEVCAQKRGNRAHFFGGKLKLCDR